MNNTKVELDELRADKLRTDELRTDEIREQEHGDSCRNLSLAFVDDKHLRVAYNHSPDSDWTRESAENYLADLKKYSDPLRLE